MTDNKNLTHHGVLGMKWGVRKDRGTSGRSTKPVSEDHKTTRALMKKPTSQLSTNELKALTSRMQLERQYSDLKPSDLKKGMNFVKTLTTAGTTVASLYALSKTPLGQDLLRAVKTKIK